MAKGTHFKFGFAYCGAARSEYGLTFDGRSPRAETELKLRLNHLFMKHDRAEIWKDTPPKIRQVVRIETKVRDESEKLSAMPANERSLFAALEKTLETQKLEAICDNVIEEMMSGWKSVIWVLTRESVEIMCAALERVTSQRQVAPVMRTNNVKIWATHGNASIDVRNAVAKEFVDHVGAGVIIATIDSMPESISLFGASTAHYAQLHFSPGALEQSENRPYKKGTSRLKIIYYIAIGTVDERVLALVLPRLEAANEIGESAEAGHVFETLKKPEEPLEVMWKRLFGGMQVDATADMSSLHDTGPDDPDDF